MSNPKSKKQTWLDEMPLATEIEKNEDGSEFIPIRIVEEKLFFLDPHWCSEHFQFSIYNANGVDFYSGIIELSVTFDGNDRKVCGAFTAPVGSYDPNNDLGATALSEATKNAAKKLGNTFGRLLNPGEKRPQIASNGIEKIKVKPKADQRIHELRDEAREKGRIGEVEKLESMYDFNVG